MSDRPHFATMDEAVAYLAARLAERPTTDAQRERYISLLLDED